MGAVSTARFISAMSGAAPVLIPKFENVQPFQEPAALDANILGQDQHNQNQMGNSSDSLKWIQRIRAELPSQLKALFTLSNYRVPSDGDQAKTNVLSNLKDFSLTYTMLYLLALFFMFSGSKFIELMYLIVCIVMLVVDYTEPLATPFSNSCAFFILFRMQICKFCAFLF